MEESNAEHDGQKWGMFLENKIQQLRKERKITQSELADAVEVTRQTIISLENGRYNASLILAHKIAQYFGVNIEDIFIFNLEEENICL
ncbi:anaerobic benzoate catabolism transcriptional regulator [[Eubacterium] contortum]|uniref:Anaerobic benzoate catabolism transcriptional regulator n=2 Tax=Lachnospirales TaxID=3085636 RepID=A0A174I4L7_9FIRM|nr:anaerobic benzoate catabolism transcriptional regulator [[Eubacterium] contortum] [Faecalicatena contorta]